MFKSFTRKKMVIVSVLGAIGIAYVQYLGAQAFAQCITQDIADTFAAMASSFEEAVLGWVYSGREIQLAYR